MANMDPLLQRNKDFAATRAYGRAGIVAKHQVYVITCLDPRTDPSAFLGLELGDAMVIRNAGGRVSPDVLKDLAYIGYLSENHHPGWTTLRSSRDPPQPVRNAFPSRRGVPSRLYRSHRWQRSRTRRKGRH